MRSLISQISLHKLEVFCAVAELGSLSKAADRLGIAQPVVSVHIKTISEKLGLQLFSRHGRGVQLTAEGERIFRWARDIVNRTMELERELNESEQGLVGQAVLAASMTVGSYVLPEILHTFCQNYPKGDISVHIATPLWIIDEIRTGNCDFGFSILDPRRDMDGLVTQKLYDEKLELVVSPNTPLPSPVLRPSDLEDLPFVTAQTGTPRREIEEDALSRHHIRRKKIIMELGHAEAIKQAVRAGAGAAYLQHSSIREELAAGSLVKVNVAQMDLTIPVFLVYRRYKKLSTFQTSLMNYMIRSLQNLNRVGETTIT